MIEINDTIFKKAYLAFKKRVESESNVELKSIKDHPYFDDRENYKYVVLNNAKNELLLKTWKEDDIGNGYILEAVKNSIQTSVVYNGKKVDNNLIDWRKKDNFNKLKPDVETERLFFNFFKSKVKDQVAFERLNNMGFSYQLIAYLFFLKNSQKYMPISQERFDAIFESLGIDLKTSHNISWENYLDYCGIIKSFKKHLSTIHKDITLLDAHSFLWIYGDQFDTRKNKTITNTTKENENNTIPEKQEKKERIDKPYQPRKAVDLNDLSENKPEIDFIEQHRKQIEIGKLAEDVVVKNEKESLKDFPDLAKNVRPVAHNPKLGFDIISWEKDGTQKQIEVKAISEKSNFKSFILTRNELKKSKEYPNYYVYCVNDINSDNPKILKIKNPLFENVNQFTIEPLTYKVTFE